MIETVIKRDGTREEANLEKIMGWAKWCERDLGKRNRWWPTMVEVVGNLPSEVHTKDITRAMIKGFRDENTWIGQRMAGRLQAIEYYYDTFGSKVPPSLKFVHDRNIEMGFQRDLGFTDAEYEELNTVIDHTRDLDLPHSALVYMRSKYAIQNRKTKDVYETHQFVYMRVAMGLMERFHAIATENTGDTSIRRVDRVKEMYDMLSRCIVTAPTPNFTSIGTWRPAAVSCVLFMVGDTAASISAGNHIAENCVTVGAGLGSFLNMRSPGDPVRGGEIVHEGLYKYLRSQAALTTQNKQGSRGGAATSGFSIYNPEREMLINLRNPRTPEARRNRLMHYAIQFNPFFIRKSLRNETFFGFNVHTAPDLWYAMFSKNEDDFARLYAQYEQDPNFKKEYANARDIHVMALTEEYSTGTIYEFHSFAVNKHTPFKEPIFQTNLCVEIVQPTLPYEHTQYLYDPTDHGKGEISTCNLSAINVAYLDVTEENEAVYAQAARNALIMVYSSIESSTYPFPHMNFTARQRRNAGVGMHGLATLLARNNIDPRTKEGLEYIHQVAERHMYHLITQAIELTKEIGLAPWIGKTYWPEGWTPKKTYFKAVDELGNFVDRYDWDDVSERLIANGGIPFSCLASIMPGESSSKPTGAPNAIWMLRDVSIKKTDGANVIDWVAPEADDLNYTIAWDMTQMEQINVVAVFQKWLDQSISLERYRKVGKAEKIESSELLHLAEAQARLGIKTAYYANTNTHTDNRATAYLTAFNRPYFDEETMMALLGEEVMEEVRVICEGCDV